MMERSVSYEVRNPPRSAMVSACSQDSPPHGHGEQS